MKQCENNNCKLILNARQEKDGLRFCCRACSNSAVKRLASIESRAKVGAKLRKPPRVLEVYCSVCSKMFSTITKRKVCGDECLRAQRKANAIQASKTMTLRGTHSGWHNRRGEPSYPEKYFMSVFEQEGVAGWKRELKVGRWFIDFAFEDRKLAVEIDGRQHQDAERKKSDEIKDAYLRDNGWEVIRILWSNPRTQKGKDELHPQVYSLLKVLSVV